MTTKKKKTKRRLPRMIIEVHMLKNYPPVNLNRDDSGAPKSCFFGGVQRGRISSQCLKRSWRTSDVFKQVGSYGVRTRKLPELVEEELLKMGVDQETAEVAKEKMTGIANKDGKTTKDGITAQIVFYSEEEIKRVAQRVKEAIDKDGNLKTFSKRSPKDFTALVEDAKVSPISADIALFGRMVTSDYFLNVDASMQVAHAISTHAVNRESDYYTAMDDLLKNNEETGAGMIGDTDYNSCCYYEYASIDTDALSANLKNAPDRDALIAKLIPALLQAMAYTNPSGKQNTFAGQIMPDLVMIECKKDKIPLSYVNAFEVPVPVWGSNPRVVENSIRKLSEHVDCMDKAYSLDITARGWFTPRYPDIQPGKCTRYESYNELVKACLSWVRGEAV